jgi:hypothetical protein
MTERPNLNTGTPWSEMDIFELRNSLEHGDPPEKVADFLSRTRSEIREKMAELGLAATSPGELPS